MPTTPHVNPTSDITVTASPVPVGPCGGSAYSHLLNLHNEARAANGAGPLTYNVLLQQAAQDHVTRMLDEYPYPSEPPNQDAAHIGFPEEVYALGYQGDTAQNVSWGPGNADVAFDAWMNSTPHRLTILGPGWHFMGIGCGTDGPRIWWVVDFGTTAS